MKKKISGKEEKTQVHMEIDMIKVETQEHWGK